MASWNYRVFKYKSGDVGIHEAYYDNKGKVNGWTKDPIIAGSSITDLLRQLTMIRKDIIKTKDEVIDYE